MKFPVVILLFCLPTAGLWAQSKHIPTIAELKQLAQCAEYTCFGSEVIQWGFAYKGERKGKIDKLAGSEYRYVRPHPNPMFAEATASYWSMNDGSRLVMLRCDNQSWIASLNTLIEQNGFTSVDTKVLLTTDDGYYTLNENGIVWHLVWKRASFFTEIASHSIILYHDPIPVRPPVATTSLGRSDTQATPIPVADKLPHLGGHWDADYPPQNAAELFRAERQYATNYDREHGKTGHTFSRCDKFRIQAKRLGQYRPLTDDRWSQSFSTALRRTNFGAFDEERPRLFRQEALFDVAGERVWLPIQELVIKTLEKESNVGEIITLYALLVSHHDFGGTLHLSFLVNEFASAATTDSFDADAKTKPAPAKPVSAGVAQKPVTGCGFNWKPWASVSASEKAEMRKTLVVSGDSNEDLLQHISSLMRNQEIIQVARFDFFGDGVPGYVVYSNTGLIEVYENLGANYLSLTVKESPCTARASEKGIAVANSRFVNFKNAVLFDQQYAQFLEFKAFIQRFSIDKVFQLSRIKFPLMWEEYVNGETTQKRSTKANWKHDNILKPSGKDYEVFVSYPSIKKPNEAGVGETCADGNCGYGAGLGFKRINGLWYCISKYFGSD